MLRSRTLDPAQGDARQLAALAEIQADTRKHLILQFSEMPDADDRAELESRGVQLVQYLGNRGWFASVEGSTSPSVLEAKGVAGAWSIEPADRLAPALRANRIPDHARNADGTVSVSVLAFADTDPADLVAEIESLGGTIQSQRPEFELLFVRVHRGTLARLAEIDGIQWIEPVAPLPQPEMSRVRSRLGTGAVQIMYGLTGAGVDVSVHDTGHAYRHNDYYNRWLKGDTDTLSVEQHATMTAGTIAGDGTGVYDFRGMAPGASIVTYDYATGTDNEANNYGDIADALTRGVEIANNSWGYVGCTAPDGLPYGDYTAQARVYDRQVRGQNSAGTATGKPMVVVFSAGNERDGYASGSSQNMDCVSEDTSPYRNYGSINQPKPAKNVIVVGAVDSGDLRMTSYSSWGPTSDGRLKPDIVAVGHEYGINLPGNVSNINNCFGSPVGASNQQCYRTTNNTNTNDPNTTYDDRYAWFSQTSAAAAEVSGSAALFIQDFRAQNSGKTPLPSTVKAHFVHTARDLDDATTWFNPGPDYASGYGLLDMQAAIDQLRTGRFVEGSIDAGQSKGLLMDVPPLDAVTVTLVWDDPPAAPGTTSSALINDLDLVVIDPAGDRHYPWTLDPAHPSAPAVQTGADHRNNVEVVYAPGEINLGNWTVQVKGTAVGSGPQSYSLVFSHDKIASTVDLVVTQLTAPSAVMPGQAITISDITKNQGTTTGPATLTRFYWSRNTTLEITDAYLAERSIPSLAAGASSGPVATNLTVPVVANGTYYLLAVADATDVVVESNESNVKTRKIVIGPDLVVSSIVVAPSAAQPGASITVTDQTRNQGTMSAPASSTHFYWSTNTTYGTGDILLAERAVPALASTGNSGPVDTQMTIPAAATGAYYIVAHADGGRVVSETSESNNTKSVQVTIGPDLTVSSLSVALVSGGGSIIKLTETTQNRGSAPAGATYTRYYLSSDSTYQATDTLLGERPIPALGGGASSGPVTTNVPVPSVVTGSYYVLAVADAAKVVDEALETNNLRSFKLMLGPDLVTYALSAPTDVASGQVVTLFETTGNQGTLPAAASTTRYYWSDNKTFESSDLYLGMRSIKALVPGQTTTSDGVAVTIPAAALGTHYFLAMADGNGAVAETSESNNLAYLQVAMIAPDLVVSVLNAPTSAKVGSSVTIGDTTKNQGTGGSGASTTRYYLSTDSRLDASDVPFASRPVGALATGTSSSGTVSGTIPQGIRAGTFYLIAVADDGKVVAETIETNNTRSRTVTITL